MRPGLIPIQGMIYIGDSPTWDFIKTFLRLKVNVMESQNCLVLPAPHKRASRPAQDFTVFFIKTKQYWRPVTCHKACDW